MFSLQRFSNWWWAMQLRTQGFFIREKGGGRRRKVCNQVGGNVPRGYLLLLSTPVIWFCSTQLPLLQIWNSLLYAISHFCGNKLKITFNPAQAQPAFNCRLKRLLRNLTTVVCVSVEGYGVIIYIDRRQISERQMLWLEARIQIR